MPSQPHRAAPETVDAFLADRIAVAEPGGAGRSGYARLEG